MRTRKFKIQPRKGRRMGEHGTRIQVSDMNPDIKFRHKSETMTVHNTTPQEVMPKIRFFLSGVEFAEEKETDVTILYKGGKEDGKTEGKIRYGKAKPDE